MIITNSQTLQQYREATKIATEILKQLVDATKIGIYPIELDELIVKLCQKYGVKPAFKGVTHSNLVYQYHSCISVNDEILHGIPSQTRKIQSGDLVKIDMGIIYQGLFTDQCVTIGIGQVDPKDRELLSVGRKSVLKGVEAVRAGATTGDVGFNIHKTATRAGFSVLTQYIGHGIGKSLHEAPEIPAYGKKGHGSLLRDQMVICVEAQVLAGDPEVYIDETGWTVKSASGQKGVMFEYMVLVKPDGHEILTPTQDWDLVKS